MIQLVVEAARRGQRLTVGEVAALVGLRPATVKRYLEEWRREVAAGGGLCPLCGRSVAELVRHMRVLEQVARGFAVQAGYADWEPPAVSDGLDKVVRMCIMGSKGGRERVI